MQNPEKFNVFKAAQTFSSSLSDILETIRSRFNLRDPNEINLYVSLLTYTIGKINETQLKTAFNGAHHQLDDAVIKTIESLKKLLTDTVSAFQYFTAIELPQSQVENFKESFIEQITQEIESISFHAKEQSAELEAISPLSKNKLSEIKQNAPSKDDKDQTNINSILNDPSTLRYYSKEYLLKLASQSSALSTCLVDRFLEGQQYVDISDLCKFNLSSLSGQQLFRLARDPIFLKKLETNLDLLQKFSKPELLNLMLSSEPILKKIIESALTLYSKYNISLAELFDLAFNNLNFVKSALGKDGFTEFCMHVMSEYLEKQGKSGINFMALLKLIDSKILTMCINNNKHDQLLALPSDELYAFLQHAEKPLPTDFVKKLLSEYPERLNYKILSTLNDQGDKEISRLITDNLAKFTLLSMDDQKNFFRKGNSWVNPIAKSDGRAIDHQPIVLHGVTSFQFVEHIDNPNHVFKFLFVGDRDVGKKNLTKKLDELGHANNYRSTFDTSPNGVSKPIVKYVQYHQKSVAAWISCPPPQNIYDRPDDRYKGTHVVIITFDVTNRESFNNVKQWLGEIDRYASPGVIKILVGNKSDLVDQRMVSAEEAKKVAKQFDLKYIETSAQNGDGVSELFNQCIASTLQKLVW